MIHRGQLFVRDCGNSRSGYFSKPIGQEDRRDYAMVGILAVPRDSYPQHIVRGFIARPGANELDLVFTDYQQPMDRDGIGCELASLATNSMWPRPDPMLGGGGGLMLRDTRMPASRHAKIMTVLAVASLPNGALANEHIYEVQGNLGRWITNPLHPGDRPGTVKLSNPSSSPIPMGTSLAQILKMPLWGWGEERVAFTSTMDLDTIDRCQKIDNLRCKQNRSVAEDEQLEELLRQDQRNTGVFTGSQRDPKFQQFLQEISQTRGPKKWDGVQTAAELQQQDAEAQKIVAQLLGEDLAA